MIWRAGLRRWAGWLAAGTVRICDGGRQAIVLVGVGGPSGAFVAHVALD
jgi:hypothetical protein